MLFTIDKNTYHSPRSRNGAAVAKAFLPSSEINHVFWDSPTTQLVPAQSPHGGELSPSTGTGPLPCLHRLPVSSITSNHRRRVQLHLLQFK